MFVTYLLSTEQEIKTSILVIKNLRGKATAEIMGVIQTFYILKSLRIDTILFSVLDSTNSGSVNKNGMQRKIKYNALFSIFISCKNHHLNLYLPHLIKNMCLGEKMKDHDSLLFGLWKKFSFFFNASFNFRTKLSFSWKATVQKYPKGVVTC